MKWLIVLIVLSCWQCAPTCVPDVPKVNTTTDNIGWDTRFGHNAPNGYVESIAILGDQIFLAGSFSAIGSSHASGIARWDGANWSDLRSSITTTPNIFANFKNTVIEAGGIYDDSSYYVAQWDMDHWLHIGDPRMFSVIQATALAIEDSSIYIVNVWRDVWKFDGKNWTFLARPPDTANYIAVTADGLYASSFTNIYFNAPHTFTWAKLHGLFSPASNPFYPSFGPMASVSIAGLYTANNSIYVFGRFSGIDSIVLNPFGIAKWDGSNWSSLKASSDTNQISSITIDEAGNMFLAEQLSSTKSRVVKWDGLHWIILGTFSPGRDQYSMILSIAAKNGLLAVGGDFGSVNGVPSSNFALLKYH